MEEIFKNFLVYYLSIFGLMISISHCGCLGVRIYIDSKTWDGDVCVRVRKKDFVENESNSLVRFMPHTVSFVIFME